MPAPRLPMRKIKEILRLKYECRLSHRKIALCLGIAHSTVGDYVRRAAIAGWTWPLPESLTEADLDAQLFAPPPPPSQRTLPDWAWVHQELHHKGVTLTLLWQEYKQQYPDGLQYSRFCDHHRKWRGQLDLVMRQDHKAGEKLFIDYAGMTVPVIDPRTGEERQAEIFVSVLGASNYTYCEATWTQALPDWIASHVRAFIFFGGVPEVLIPDNLKSGVHKAHRYEPEINRTYADLAQHYGVAVMPARVRKPRDKAKVEAGVRVVEQQILARLRHRTFFSLDDLNEALSEGLEQLNHQPFQKLPGSRCTQFEQLDQPVLKPLPSQHYKFAEWKKARVNVDCHIELDRHYYSVPHQLVKKQLDIRYTAHTVECFFRGNRVASHVRSPYPGRHTTEKVHLPHSFREYASWTPDRILSWAAKIGPQTQIWVERALQARSHPLQAYRSCLGVLRLSKGYGSDRLEAACQRALDLQTYSYRSIESILKKGLDQLPPEPNAEEPPPIQHRNIRGPGYYRRSSADHNPSSPTTAGDGTTVEVYATTSNLRQTRTTPTERHGGRLEGTEPSA
jgi:transposase